MKNGYILLFKPVRFRDMDPNDPAVLMPILVHDDGRQLALDDAGCSVEKAMAMSAGFELARWIEMKGGFDAIEEAAQERDTEKK